MSKSFSQSLLTTVAVSVATSTVMFVGLTLVSFLPVRQELSRLFGRTSMNAQATTTLQVPSDGISRLTGTDDDATVMVVKKVQPSIVAILVSASAGSQKLPDMLSFPFDPSTGQPLLPPTQKPPKASTNTQVQIAGGSGFFVSSDGLVVTNKHMVDFDGATFMVLATDGKKYPAKVLATDPLLDLAFLKVDGQHFSYLTFTDSDKIVPGQTVIAIGNALDEFRNTVTKGIVSGLNRSVVAGDGADSELIEEAIQTDAAINPGNSGGPLIDLHGDVVGMNTAVSEEGQSLGFALPANTILRDVNSVQKNGRIVRPFLGVRYVMVTDDLIKKNQLSVDHGALVLRGTSKDELAVMPGSPADKAGIVENDILLEVDGQSVDDAHSLSSLVGRHVPGDQVKIRVMHAGTDKTVTVTLEELKPETP